MPAKENLYFIAIIPPEGVSEEVTAFKKDFAARFASAKALKVMPHITLKSPFKLASSLHLDFLDWFKRLKIGVSPFTIELNNFGSFPRSSHPVIFVDLTRNPLLYSLQKKVILNCKSIFQGSPLDYEVDDKFHPHMTIAYRDLSFENYKQAWEEYKTKKYTAGFKVNSFCLLQHDSKRWNIIDTYHL